MIHTWHCQNIITHHGQTSRLTSSTSNGRTNEDFVTSFQHLATIDPKTEQEELQRKRSNRKLYYDQNAKLLKHLDKGNTVVVKDGKWKPAKVTKIN